MTTMRPQFVENASAPALPWYRRRLGVLISSLVVPPVGLVLLWLRPWKGGVVRRAGGLAGRLALSGLLVILTLVYLVRLGVLHMEMSGAGWRPIFSLRDPKLDQDALEKHRAQQAAHAPAVAAPSATAEAAPEPAAAPEAEAGKSSATPAGDAASAKPAHVAYWTDFFGPNRDGNYRQMAVRTAWPSEGLKPLWRQPVGGGYASFVAADGRAFSIEQRRGNEVVAAYDIQSGRELWTNAWPALFHETMGGDGPRATPTWHEGKLYALGATGEFRCIDAQTGKTLWSKNILSDNGAENIMWGMANSPLVVDEKVIVTPGGRSSGRSVVAYHKLTGERIWGALEDQAAYTSPVGVDLLGERMLLVVTAKRIVGLRAETGALLWEYPWATMYDINSAQPIVVDGEHVFVSAGYDHGSALLKIAKNGDRYSATQVWENRNMKNRFNSSVLHAGAIFGFDEAIFACIDARTGERKWKAGRYGYGQTLLVKGGDGQAYLIVITEQGDLVLLRANPAAHEEVARFSAIEGKTWNHMAIEGGVLLVRNLREMAAFDLRLK